MNQSFITKMSGIVGVSICEISLNETKRNLNQLFSIFHEYCSRKEYSKFRRKIIFIKFREKAARKK